ncbi:DUF2637 domain-containing protein [Streptomyces sp. NPDC054844]
MVVFGGVIIAGIGFAGSYAAVRELALQKGFGNFSYVFPIGIDAGICVLLALDLLLTWIRIPFPLLRQTAWLLTAATIAFNGAAAWPDPLGVGMHGVIPILFVVSVEAARHAIGRIADITADKHMEGVRLTRWLLSPGPTFLLWRRMKLWELRSYEQVIKLEQERLVYQARLRSRFGRGWRRKAPVESLMPLRLARYGVPLSQTAPAGLAAAGIEPALLPPSPQAEALPGGRAVHGTAPSLRKAEPAGEQRPELVGGREPEPEPVREQAAVGQNPAVGPNSTSGQNPAAGQYPAMDPNQNPWLHARDPQSVEYHGDYDPAYDPDQYAQWEAEQRQAEQYRQQNDHAPPLADPPPEETTRQQSPARPHSHTPAKPGASPQTETDQDTYSSQGPYGPSEPPKSEQAHQPPLSSGVPSPADGALPPDQKHPEPAPVSCAARPATAQRTPHVTAAVNNPRTSDDNSRLEPPTELTTVDRYYLAWAHYQDEHGAEPKPEQLSAYLAAQGMHGRGGKPVSPANLRRYLLPFRLYNLWAQHRKHEAAPSPDAIARQCAAHGITAQHNQPLTPHHITHHTTDFERRWHTLNHHPPQTHHK